MKSVVVGAVIAATLAAAIPCQRRLLFAIVRTSSFATMNMVRIATGAGIATMPSAAPCASARTCRMVRSSSRQGTVVDCYSGNASFSFSGGSI
jgi:hypothetical protein